MFRNREVLLYTAISAVFSAAALILCRSVIALAACVCVYAASMVFTVRRYRKIAELAAYLQRLVGGATALDIRDNAEGELSILKNEIYKAANSLTEQAEGLRKDKLELASALSDISHQLKTPLTSLGIMTDLLSDDNLPNEKRTEFLDSIRSGLDRMEWLVLSLLKLARLDADAVTLRKEKILFSTLTQKSLAPMLIPMEIKGQNYAVHGEDAYVSCDPDWTAEALTNIIKNAVEITPDGGDIEIRFGNNPLYSFIAVYDNGPGIPAADMPHLFKRFYRGQNATPDSTGIGLAMSLAIMRKQNGDIEVSNDCGGAFTLKIYHITE